MAKNHASETVEQYFHLWSQKNYQGCRAYLADDLFFKGPFDRFHRADDLINALSRLGPIVKEIRETKMLSDGQNVCLLYDMVTTQVGTVPIAEVFEVRSGMIISILAFFDPRPFVPLFA